MFRTTATLAVLLLATASLSSLAAQDHDHNKPVPGGGKLPAGWSARPDDGATIENVKFVPMGQGYHLTLGPATVLYQAKDHGKGPFHTLATFTEGKAASHAEGYGLFYGGNALTEAGQHYVYFLIRGDGQYLIKRRDGDETTEVVGWTAHDAIKVAKGQDKASNALEIDATRTPGKVEFIVNGKTVHVMDAAPAELKGIIGLRANHNLDLHIEGFAIHR